MQTWHANIGGQSKGPFTRDEIAQLIAKKELDAESLIWTASFGSNWQPLRMSELADLIKTPPPSQAVSPPPLSPAPPPLPAQAAAPAGDDGSGGRLFINASLAIGALVVGGGLYYAMSENSMKKAGDTCLDFSKRNLDSIHFEGARNLRVHGTRNKDGKIVVDIAFDDPQRAGQIRIVHCLVGDSSVTIPSLIDQGRWR